MSERNNGGHGSGHDGDGSGGSDGSGHGTVTKPSDDGSGHGRGHDGDGSGGHDSDGGGGEDDNDDAWLPVPTPITIAIAQNHPPFIADGFFQGMPRAGCERRLSSLIAAGRRDWLFFLNAPCAPKIHPTGLVSRTHEDCFIDSGEPHADPR